MCKLMRSQCYDIAAEEQQQPSSSKMTEIDAPYLDAIIEEVLCISDRLSLENMIILGHTIPKGTSSISYTVLATS